MSNTTYNLTDDQRLELRCFVYQQLADAIDETLSGEWLINDELITNDDFDEINRRKMAALEYIKSIL